MFFSFFFPPFKSEACATYVGGFPYKVPPLKKQSGILRMSWPLDGRVPFGERKHWVVLDIDLLSVSKPLIEVIESFAGVRSACSSGENSSYVMAL